MDNVIDPFSCLSEKESNAMLGVLAIIKSVIVDEELKVRLVQGVLIELEKRTETMGRPH